MAGNDTASLAARLAQYDAEHDLLRLFGVPEEDRAKFTSGKWDGGYRWFKSPNVICLEKARRLRLQQI